MNLLGFYRLAVFIRIIKRIELKFSNSGELNYSSTTNTLTIPVNLSYPD